MGRSSGKNKVNTSSATKTRSSIIREKEQRLFSTEESNIAVNKPLKRNSSYTPFSNHQILVKDALSQWMYDPINALDPSEAFYRFRGSEKNMALYPEKNNLEYWQRVRDALLHEIENGTISSETVFRGQPFEDGHPLDRPRSWSKNPQKAVSFAISNLHVIAPDGTTRTESGMSSIKLDPGERVFIRLYAAHGVKRGIDVNRFLEEGRKQDVIDDLNKGIKKIRISFFNGENYVQDSVSLEDEKEKVLKIAKEVIGEDRVVAIINDYETSENEYSDLSPEEIGIPIQAIDRIALDSENKDILNYWQREKERVFSSVKEKEFAQRASNSFFREDEVILHPSKDENIRRIDVFIGDNEDEIKNTPIIDMTDKILKKLESLKGDHVNNAAAHQQTLFVEGIDF